MEQISSDELKLRHERIASLKLILGEEKRFGELCRIIHDVTGYRLVDTGRIRMQLLQQMARTSLSAADDLLKRLDPNASLGNYPIGIIAGQEIMKQLAGIRTKLGHINSGLIDFK